MIPRVFTIPNSVPFLPTLIRALADGNLVSGFPGSDPLALASATVYLPTLRACRAATELFCDTLGCEAAVLPRISALGDIDEDELAFDGRQEFAVPQAIGALDRRLLLARLVMEWVQSPELHGASGAPLVAARPGAALSLADELARLIDDMITRRVAWDRLDDLVPEQFDPYWQLSLRFLKIARNHWPAILAQRGCLEPADRRDRLIAAEALRLQVLGAPVIAAGSTGSMPSTAALLTVISGLPQGAVVLPGLDTSLEKPAWDAIGGTEEAQGDAGHPQFAMRALLARIGVDRELVVTLGAERGAARARLISEAFRPASTSEQWQYRLHPDLVTEAMAGMVVIEAASAEEEAAAVGVALREAVEAPGERVGLVTSDIALARRVAAQLKRWNVAVEDSRRTSLAAAGPGVFARLAAEVSLGRWPPGKLLALVKHPLFRLGAGGNARAIAALEGAVLRGPAPRAGASGARLALSAVRQHGGSLHPRDPRAGISTADLDAAAALIDALAAALEPLGNLHAGPHCLAEFAARHRDVVAALGEDAGGETPALTGEHGSRLWELFEELASRASAEDLRVQCQDYPELFRTILEGEKLALPPMPGAKIEILGPLEARLQSFDTLVIGELVEGSWPPQIRADPWLSRPMRHDLGLDLPERRTGLAAHDFAQCLGARRIVLARSCKLAGAPTVPSRFLQRLAAVIGPDAWRAALARGEPYLAWACSLDQSPRVRIGPPAPRPPRDARPNRISVTDVEHWLRDPYTIYAKHILRLEPLEPVEARPGARDRGNLLHAIVGEFTQARREGWPDDPVGEFLDLARKHFAAFDHYPEARAVWWPRLLRIADWFVEWEANRRPLVTCTQAELSGELAIPLGERSFKLTARADRIDQLDDGRYAIVDYKTGDARTEKQVRSGLAPQLTLEAAIVRQGGFAGIPRGADIGQLAYVTLRGGDPAGEEIAIDFTEGTANFHADRALERFTELIRLFDSPDQPFRSLVHSMWKYRYGEYDHLARVKEWSAAGAEEPNGT
jgi:ATP-dependent helicase/nuclease subunit B